MTDLERARTIWLRWINDNPPFPPAIEAMVDALAAARQEGAEAALEEAARLHENIDPACDHERQKGHPGAGAMGAVIRYRDAIRALKDKRHD